jgi:hypothetical protein
MIINPPIPSSRERQRLNNTHKNIEYGDKMAKQNSTEKKADMSSSELIKNAILKPEEALEGFKTTTDDKGPFMLYGVVMILVFLAVVITTGNLLNSIIAAVVMTILGIIYAIFAKIPFKILSGNRSRALGNSLVAVGLFFVQFMIGVTIFAILMKLAMLLNNSMVVGIAVIIGVLVLVYYLLVALSVSAKAFKELFDTDYIVVMIANGIVTTAMVIVVYGVIMIAYMGIAMYALTSSMGKGLY